MLKIGLLIDDSKIFQEIYENLNQLLTNNTLPSLVSDYLIQNIEYYVPNFASTKNYYVCDCFLLLLCNIKSNHFEIVYDKICFTINTFNLSNYNFTPLIQILTSPKLSNIKYSKIKEIMLSHNKSALLSTSLKYKMRSNSPTSFECIYKMVYEGQNKDMNNFFIENIQNLASIVYLPEEARLFGKILAKLKEENSINSQEIIQISSLKREIILLYFIKDQSKINDELSAEILMSLMKSPNLSEAPTIKKFICRKFNRDSKLYESLQNAFKENLWKNKHAYEILNKVQEFEKLIEFIEFS